MGSNTYGGEGVHVPLLNRVKNEIKKEISKYLMDFLIIIIHHFQQKIYMKIIKIKMKKLYKLLMNHELIQEISENENPKKIVNINEKIIDFNKQQDVLWI